jgi:hypothetical protein
VVAVAAEEPTAQPPAGPARGTEGAADRVRNPGELWRIEGSLTAVRQEVNALQGVDEERLRDRVAALERRWRTELDTVLPESLVDELHRFLDWSGETGAGSSELRIGLAQLEGWLDGVISGMGFVVVEPPPR